MNTKLTRQDFNAVIDLLYECPEQVHEIHREYHPSLWRYSWIFLNTRMQLNMDKLVLYVGNQSMDIGRDLADDLRDFLIVTERANSCISVELRKGIERYTIAKENHA